jgi:uroporphyrinogen III methyltransferase/synthase
MPTADLSTNQPLSARTIIITRARAQAADFAAQLESYGARVIACPTIEIVAPESYDTLDEAISNLYGYDWLIFTSANGVEHFLKRFESLGHEINELDDLRVCAIGDATARKLEDRQIHVDLIPEQFKAEGVLAALIAFVGGPDALARLNFLLPRAAVARDYLPEQLEEIGVRVDVVAAYHTVRPAAVDLTHINTLLAGGGIDCITFTSGSSVRNFAALFDISDLSVLLEGVAIACIGEVTAKVATEFGLQTEILPPASTTTSLATAIARYFAGEEDR